MTSVCRHARSAARSTFLATAILACPAGVAQAQDPPAVAVGDVTVTEGHAGSADALFTLTRSGDLAGRISLTFTTANGTAVSGKDYTAVAGTAIIPSGAATATLAVPVIGDLLDEDDETFTVHLTGIDVSGPPPEFRPHQQFFTGKFLRKLVTADFNGDGKLDIATANPDGFVSVSVLINTTPDLATTPSFFVATTLSLPGVNPYPINIVTADFNGDGKPDIAVTDSFNEQVRVWLNTTPDGSGSASFSASQGFSAINQPWSIAAADLNGDGRPDLVATGTFTVYSNRVTVLLNTTPAGSATASFTSDFIDPGTAPGGLVLADLDGSGTPDLIVSSGTAFAVRLNFTSPGAGAVSLADPQYFAALGSEYVAAHDMNGDGRLDLLALANPIVTGSDDFSLLLNETPSGSSTLAFGAPGVFDVGAGPGIDKVVSLAVGDLNGDGRPDVATLHSYSNPGDGSILTNTMAPGATTPSFAPFTPFGPLGQLPTGVTAADFNADGRADLAVANWGASSLSLSVLLNQTGTFVSPGTLADDTGLGTITDDDDAPTVAWGAAALTVGEAAGAVPVTATLSAPSGRTITVPFAVAGTATRPADHDLADGVITIPPETPSASATLHVVDDILVEGTEDVVVTMGAPTNANAASPGTETITITDDDALLAAGVELAHGSDLAGALPARAGPVADKDDYRLAQAPWSSYEVIVEPGSAGVAPATLHRLAADGTLLQEAAAGVGGVASLRWENASAVAEDGEYVRVAGACASACSADDAYRIRAYDTTGAIARFNNAGSQVTVLFLQNPSGQVVAGSAHFWSTAGAKLASVPFSLTAYGSFVLNTSTVPGLAGVGGAITVTSDAPYGALAGKAVAVDAGAGFSFDSPLLPRPR